MNHDVSSEEGRDALRGAGGIVKLVSLLTSTDDRLLTNAAHALANAAQDSTLQYNNDILIISSNIYTCIYYTFDNPVSNPTNIIVYQPIFYLFINTISFHC